jgi:hypothetical protein
MLDLFISRAKLATSANAWNPVICEKEARGRPHRAASAIGQYEEAGGAHRDGGGIESGAG